MSDLIERDKAIDAIREHIKVVDGDDDALDYIATNMLKDVPSARPKGEWIDRGMRVPSSWVKKCSLCGHETDTWRWCKFCPNCGADMREREGE